MADELSVQVDTGGLENASADATQSAISANEAAARADAAAVNQGQLIETVTAYAREDAQSAAAEANAAATSAEESARFILDTKDAFIAEVSAILAPLMSRIESLESSHHEPPQIVQNNEPGVTPIDPQQTEQSMQEEHQEAGNETGNQETPSANSSGRRRHGRRRR